MSLKLPPILKTDECEQLAKVLTKTKWVRSSKSRKYICKNIEPKILEEIPLSYLEQESDIVFTTFLVNRLIDSDNIEALLKLCYFLKIDLQGQVPDDSNNLKNICKKIVLQYLKIYIFPKLNGKYGVEYYLLCLKIFNKKLQLINISVSKVIHENINCKNVLLASFSVTFIVTLARFIGLILVPEFMFYDLFMKLKIEQQDKKVLIVEITQENLNKYIDKWQPDPKNRDNSIADKAMKDLLERLKIGKPSVIGIDILRDKQQPSGSKDHQELIKYLELPEYNNIFTICVFGDKETLNRDGKEPPSQKWLNNIKPRLNRVGFNNALRDTKIGNSIRKQLLKIDNESPNKEDNLKKEDSLKEEGCKTNYSFSYLVATRYLENLGKKIEDIKKDEYDYENNLRIINNDKSTTEFFPLDNRDIGGYQGINESIKGKQILINYRSNYFEKEYEAFYKVDIEKFNELADDKLLGLVKDKIVLIGYTAETKKDLYSTPINPQMPGVIIHAHMVSQIINAALEGRPLLLPLPLILEVGLVFTCSLVGGILSRPTKVSIGILVLNGVCYVAFIGGTWLPVVPSMLVLFFTPIMAKLIPRLFQSSIASEA